MQNLGVKNLQRKIKLIPSLKLNLQLLQCVSRTHLHIHISKIQRNNKDSLIFWNLYNTQEIFQISCCIRSAESGYIRVKGRNIV